MRPLLSLVAFVLLLALLPGCTSRLNCTRLEDYLGRDVDLVDLGSEIGRQLAAESFPPLVPRNPEQPVLVTTLVSNDNLTKSSAFGRSLQNAIAAELVRQGYAVNEVRLRGNVLLAAGEGEFMLSRDLMELQEKQKAQAVVVGTYSLANRVMYLSVRLVSPAGGHIRSAYEQRLCLDENTLRMLGLELIDDDEIVQPPSEPLLDKVFY